MNQQTFALSQLLKMEGDGKTKTTLTEQALVRVCLENQILYNKLAKQKTTGKRQAQPTSNERPVKRQRVESQPDDERRSNFEKSDAEYDNDEVSEVSEPGPTGSLQGVENMTRFEDRFTRDRKKGKTASLPKPGQISRHEEEEIEKEGGDYEARGIETVDIPPSRTTGGGRTSALEGSRRGGQSSHGSHSSDRDSHKTRRSAQDQASEIHRDDEGNETVTFFGQEVPVDKVANMPVFNKDTGKFNQGFAVLKELGEENVISAIGSQGGRHSHDNDPQRSPKRRSRSRSPVRHHSHNQA